MIIVSVVWFNFANKFYLGSGGGGGRSGFLTEFEVVMRLQELNSELLL